MSSTTLQFTFRVGGTLTDPDSMSVVFSDPTAAFAVNRTDTNAAVTPPTVNQAFTRISTGIYQFTVTDPAYNLIYQWWAKYSYLGGVNYVQFATPGTVTPVTPNTPSAIIDNTMMGTNSNSYALIADATLCFLKRGYTSVWTAQSADSQCMYLMWATTILDRVFRYPGFPTSLQSALRWPRVGVRDRDGKYLDTASYPQPIIDATCVLALELAKTDRSIQPPVVYQGISELRVGPIDLKIDTENVIALVPPHVIAIIDWAGEIMPTGQSPKSMKVMRLSRT